MRIATCVAFCALIAGLARPAVAAPAPSYYLALGDSLAQGVQPSRTGVLVETNQGYVDDLFGLYRLGHPGLKLAKLGCSGETTRTMLLGGDCAYPTGSQLAQAVQFLQTHRVALITLTIGGDDILHCISTAGIDQACLVNGVTNVGTDLPQILGTLRAAAPGVPIVAMNYYDPFLAAWVLSPTGPVLALQSQQATLALNALLQSLYDGFGVPVADVASAFRLTDFNNAPPFQVPVNVLIAFSWTWMGAPPPIGPDIHPNAFGYAVIAGAFVKTIGHF